jgi:hypothetical protein
LAAPWSRLPAGSTAHRAPCRHNARDRHRTDDNRR